MAVAASAESTQRRSPTSSPDTCYRRLCRDFADRSAKTAWQYQDATTSAMSTCACFHARMSETKRQKLLGAARATSNPSFSGRRIESICTEAIFHLRNSRRAQLAAQRVKQREVCRSRRGRFQRWTNLSIEEPQRRNQTPFDLPTRAAVGDLKAAAQPVPRLRRDSSRLQLI